MGCKAPIDANEPAETLRFEPTADHRLDELNGTYHQRCAKPLLSLYRTLGTLRNNWS